MDSASSLSTDTSTALLSTASTTSSPAIPQPPTDDMQSIDSEDSEPPNEDSQMTDSQMTDFGSLDETIYQFIEDHATHNLPLRRQIETLLQASPRPFSTFAEFIDCLGDKDAQIM